MIAIETARQLIDFRGGTATHRARLSDKRAEEQLEGAVAIHNLLEQHRVAYLADEVGLGKTYVALGAFALFRHFNPRFRLLVIAPKKNIQAKWIKELQNFTRNNVRFADLRVRAIHGAPARPPIYCENLYELVRETSLDPDRDFFVRLTSFSFGLSEDSDGWRKRRDKLRELLPWLHEDLFDLRSKDRFKENYARAVCCALPFFDLVIVDEGHNLKGGLARTAALRNRLVALTFGNADARRFDGGPKLPTYGSRAARLLFLSATPVEDDYAQLWNQLNVFGLGSVAPELNDPNASDEDKRKAVSRFLIRRVSTIDSSKTELTKNLYRREWRAGGVAVHDKPLPVPDDRQRLVVALVQKKVSELLANDRFNHSFQIGMLASFESFLKTAKVAVVEGAPGTFDGSEQTNDDLEREGIDVNAVNQLTESYRRRFGKPMPHPKMDALVEMLRSAFDTGRKALVFVRRVASVKEIERKLENEYDEWLFKRLRSELHPELRQRMERLIEQYRVETSSRVRSEEVAALDQSRDPEVDETSEDVDDKGGNDTFFAWFFRGEGPPGVFSGAAIANRFTQSRYALSSFFADNYVADLLGVAPGSVFETLRSSTVGTDLQERLERDAGSLLRRDQKKRGHADLFFAFQYAALNILASGGKLANEANAVLAALQQPVRRGGAPVPLGDWLERATFFTELRTRPLLCKALWLPQEENSLSADSRFRRRELRRELLASLLRRGHAYIDLYIAIANRLGRLEARGAEGEDLDNTALARDVLDFLERQRDRDEFRAYHELREASAHFDLILDVNAPNLWTSALEEVPREIGRLLRAQQPIGGMFGEVNKTLVTQFRMPGYPFALITTDLLQEGEDLHLFCSDVYHYGISWMPSSMEQRIGRIDRLRSATERRLGRLEGPPTGPELLQVYYPHLRETVEVFQVNRVLERVDRFIRLMHETLGTADDDREKKINLLAEVQRTPTAASINREPLRSSFPVLRELLRGQKRPLEVPVGTHDDLMQRFFAVQDHLEREGVAWQSRTTEKNVRVGTTAIGDRHQTFTVFLHSINGHANIRCVSAIGQIDIDVRTDEISRAAAALPVRIGAVHDPRFRQYNLTAEADVILDGIDSDLPRARWLIQTTSRAADQLEEVLIQLDQDAAAFLDDIQKEPQVER